MSIRICLAAAAAFYLLTTSEVARAAEPNPGSTSPLQAAAQEYAKEKFSKAANLLLAYTESAPADPEGWFWLGNTSLQMGRARDAVDALTRAVLLRPDYIAAYRPLGLAEYQTGNRTAAFRHWQLAISLNSRDQQSKYYLGVLLFEGGDSAAAETWLQQALTDKADDPKALLYMGLCEQQLKHPEHAQELFQQSVNEGVAQHAASPQAFYALAEYERRAGREDLALPLLERAAALCPEAHALTALGNLYKEQKRSSDAERVLRQAVSLDPNFAEAHYKLALLLKANQKPAEARAELAAFERTKPQTTFPDVEK